MPEVSETDDDLIFAHGGVCLYFCDVRFGCAIWL